MRMRLMAGLLILAGGLLGQKVTIAPGVTEGSGGTVIKLAVSVTNSGGAAPAGVQWKLSLPSQLTATAWTEGPAATGAGKTLHCEKPAGAAPVCLVWGMNANPIGDGVVAIVDLAVSGITGKASFSVRTTETVAGTAEGSGISSSGKLSASRCDLDSTETVDAVDVGISVDQALGRAGCALADVDGSGKCDVLDVLRVVESAGTGVCRIP